MTSPRNGSTHGLGETDGFVLPDRARLYTPPGSKMPMPTTRMKPFRPVHENADATHDIFDRLMEPTRAAQQAAEDVKTVNFHSYAPSTPPPSFPDNPLPVEDPADKAGNELKDVLYIEDDGTHRYLNLQAHPKRSGVFIALDADGFPLMDKSGPRGKEIHTDKNGYVLPPKKTPFTKLKNALANTDGAQGADKPVTVYTREGIPLGDFDVVGAGKTPTDGNGRRGTRIMAYLTGASLVGAALMFTAGTLLGRSAVPAEGQITAAEAENYHLDKFPVEAASSFGQHYLTLCFTHPEYREDVDSRNQMLAGMEAPGVPTNCGWERGGAASAVTSVAFNGQVEEREEYTNKDTGARVAYMGFFVTMNNGRQFTATVPIWSGVNEQNRPAYSIVGSVGMSAATAVNPSPDMKLAAPQDRNLAGQLEPTLHTFFDAWADSDAEALNAILTREADGEARSGLDGTVSNPEFNNIIIYPSRKPDKVNGDTAEWHYQDGDKVTAMVDLTWQVNDDAGGHEQPNGYRVTLTHSGGKWEVSGLDSGVVVPGDKSGKQSGEKNETGNVGGGLTGGFSTDSSGKNSNPVQDDTSSGSSGASSGDSPAGDSGKNNDSNSGSSDKSSGGSTGTTPGATANENLGPASAAGIE